MKSISLRLRVLYYYCSSANEDYPVEVESDVATSRPCNLIWCTVEDPIERMRDNAPLCGPVVRIPSWAQLFMTRRAQAHIFQVNGGQLSMIFRAGKWPKSKGRGAFCPRRQRFRQLTQITSGRTIAQFFSCPQRLEGENEISLWPPEQQDRFHNDLLRERLSGA